MQNLHFLKRGLMIALTVSLLAGCNKNKFDAAVKEVKLDSDYDLNAVFFLDKNEGFLSGGKRYDIGVFFKTKDGGNTWSKADSIIPKACYDMFFFNSKIGYIVGYDSHFAFTNDSGNTFYSRTFTEYLPAHAISLNSSGVGAIACGDGYAVGAIITTPDSGKTFWQSSRYKHAFRSAAVTDEGVIFIGGYGTILYATDGETFNVSKQYGDFYTDIEFINNNTGFAVGYQGEIIRTYNRGASWEVVKKINQPFETPDHFLAVDFWDAATGVAVGENGLMMKTTDGGDTWKRAQLFTSKSLRDVKLIDANTAIVAAESGTVFQAKF